MALQRITEMRNRRDAVDARIAEIDRELTTTTDARAEAIDRLKIEAATADYRVEVESKRFDRIAAEVEAGRFCPHCGRTRYDFATEDGWMSHQQSFAASPSDSGKDEKSAALARQIEFVLRLRTLESEAADWKSRLVATQDRTTDADRALRTERERLIAERRDLAIAIFAAVRDLSNTIERDLRAAILDPPLSSAFELHVAATRHVLDLANAASPSEADRKEQLIAAIHTAVHCRCTLLGAVTRASDGECEAIAGVTPPDAAARIAHRDLLELIALRNKPAADRLAALTTAAAAVAGESAAYESVKLEWLGQLTVEPAILTSDGSHKP